MIKPVVFVDIDGVMSDSVPYWLFLHNRDHNTDFKKSDVTEWDTRVCIGADLSPYFGDYTLINPVFGAIQSVRMLSTRYRIVYATAGQGSDWLCRYFSKPEIVKIDDKSLLRGFALIDDKPMNLDGFVGERFLLSQPWNSGRGLNETTWEEITRYLLSI